MKVLLGDKNLTGKSLAFVFAAVFFTGLGLLGFPSPMMDDLFFVGAGLNLASGGDFSNPLLARQNFPGTLYFVHPPLHSYAVAGWLKIFGISTASMLAFQIVMYVLICWAAIWILRKHQSPRLLEWLLPLAVTAALLSAGLRPEPLSIMLTMFGFALLECLGGEAIVVFCGFLLIFLGASAASRLSLFSAAMAMAAFVRLLRGGVPVVRLVALAGSALLVALFIFSCLIDFQFNEFFKIYHFHAAGRVGGGILGQLGHFLRGILGVTQWPLMMLWLVSLPLLWRLRSPAGDLARIGLVNSGVLLALAAFGLLGYGAIWYLAFSLFALATAFAGQASPRRTGQAHALLAAALLIANSRTCVEILGLATGHIETKKNSVAIPRPARDQTMLIDPFTARYVFDYRLPRGVLDWNFAAPFPQELATDTALRPGDVYVLGPAEVAVLNQNNWLDQLLPEWNPLHVGRWSFYQHPRWTYVIYAKDCLKDKSQN